MTIVLSQGMDDEMTTREQNVIYTALFSSLGVKPKGELKSHGAAIQTTPKRQTCRIYFGLSQSPRSSGCDGEKEGQGAGRGRARRRTRT